MPGKHGDPGVPGPPGITGPRSKHHHSLAPNTTTAHTHAKLRTIEHLIFLQIFYVMGLEWQLQGLVGQEWSTRKGGSTRPARPARSRRHAGAQGPRWFCRQPWQKRCLCLCVPVFLVCLGEGRGCGQEARLAKRVRKGLVCSVVLCSLVLCQASPLVYLPPRLVSNSGQKGPLFCSRANDGSVAETFFASVALLFSRK